MVNIVRFDSWTAFMAGAESRWAGRDHSFSRNNGKSFSGTNNWDEAVDLMKNGWRENVPALSKLVAARFSKLSSFVERQTIQYQVEGQFFDVARVLHGEPECWAKFDKQIQEGKGRKHIRITLNCCVSCGVSAAVITARGIAVATLIALLERVGNRVELIVGGSARMGDRREEIYTRVKNVGQPLDYGRMLFATSHPSMLRRMMFSLWEEKNLNLFASYPEPLSQNTEVMVPEAMYGNVQWSNPEQAEKWILETLKNQGVKLIGGK